MKSYNKILWAVVLICISSRNVDAAIIYASAALKAGYSTVQTTDTSTVPKTNFASYAIDSSLGFRMFGLILGANAEYALWNQLTDPSKVSSINTQGKLLGISPIFGFEFGAVRFIGKLPSYISGSYSLDRSNTSGQKLKYKDADTMSLQFHWKSTPLTFLGIEYQSIKFNKVDTAGTESTLTSEKKLKLNSIGLLYGLYF